MTDTAYRCQACGKWSHAQKKPKWHKRFLSENEDVEPEPETVISYEEGFSSGGREGDWHAGGWWVKCGPFDTYQLTRVQP